MNYIIGVDGGGTKTAAILLGQDGNLYGRAIGSSTNCQTVGIEETTKRIMGIIVELSNVSNIPLNSISKIVCCLAGIDSNLDQQNLENALTVLAPELNIDVYNDGVASLYSVDGTGRGAIVAAGTGSIAFARDDTDTLYRLGGWGHKLGDLGSGYDIGRRALIAILSAAEEIAPSTLLEQSICDFLNFNSSWESISWSNHVDREPKDFAALVPLVVQAAEKGDHVAIGILHDTGIQLGIIASQILNKGKWTEKQVTLTGGLSHIWQWIGPAMMDKVEEEHQKVTWKRALYPPVIGVGFLAFAKLGITITLADDVAMQVTN